jgi:hypothetical protein
MICERKLFVSNAVFLVAQCLRNPYSPYFASSILIDWETVQQAQNHFVEWTPGVDEYVQQFRHWVWGRRKDKVHYTSTIRLLKSLSHDFTLFDWQYAVHILNTYYVNH